MRELTAEDIKNYIEIAREAVDLSGFGPLFLYGGTPEKPTKTIVPAAFQVYGIVLQGLLSKADTISVKPTEPPSTIDLDTD